MEEQPEPRGERLDPPTVQKRSEVFDEKQLCYGILATALAGVFVLVQTGNLDRRLTGGLWCFSVAIPLASAHLLMWRLTGWVEWRLDVPRRFNFMLEYAFVALLLGLGLLIWHCSGVAALLFLISSAVGSVLPILYNAHLRRGVRQGEQALQQIIRTAEENLEKFERKLRERPDLVAQNPALKNQAAEFRSKLEKLKAKDDEPALSQAP